MQCNHDILTHYHIALQYGILAFVALALVVVGKEVHAVVAVLFQNIICRHVLGSLPENNSTTGT